MIERMYMLCLMIIIKSEVWTITHCLGLGHETMMCAVCLFVFLWDIKNNAWVAVNKDFVNKWSHLPMIFASDKVSSENHWQSTSQVIKNVIHGNECFILFLTCYLMSWRHNSAKKNRCLFLSPLSPRKIFSDLALWHHHDWSVWCHSNARLALWHHICRLFLHAQIGTNAIFTSE